MITKNDGNKGAAPAPVPTLRDAVDNWLRPSATLWLSPQTRRDYRVIADRHLPGRIDLNLAAAAVTAGDVRTTVLGMLADGLPGWTAAQARSLLVGVLDEVARGGRNVPILSAGSYVPRVKGHLSQAEAACLLDSIWTASPERVLLYVLALAEGVSLDEALALTWADIDLSRWRLRVRPRPTYAWDAPTAGLPIFAPIDTLTVDYGAVVKCVLDLHFALAASTGSAVRATDHLFSPFGVDPWTAQLARDLLAGDLQAARLPQVAFDDLRCSRPLLRGW